MTSDANRARHKKFLALSDVGRLKGSAYCMRGVVLSIRQAATTVVQGGAAARLGAIYSPYRQPPEFEPADVRRLVFCHDRAFARLDDPDTIVLTRWSIGPRKDDEHAMG